MTNTTYYGLNIVEGTDIVNPLIVDNPNYNKIDEVMHENAVSGVTLATEIANATVHAITRENSECSVIRFIATSVWKAGDTVTVDGVPVTALLPSGETLPNGAYVINANVLCILTGTNLTVYAERKKTDSANEIAYNDTSVGAELDKINSNLESVSASLPYINPSNILHSYKRDTMYEAVQDCIACGFVKLPQGMNMSIKINNVQIQYLSNDANEDSVITLPIYIPIKSRQRLTISTSGGDITVLGQWSIDIYATA